MLKSIIKSSAICTVLLVTSCTFWPDSGHGGLADKTNTPFLQRPLYHAATTPREILKQRLLIARNYLENLKIAGADACFPAHWQMAYQQANLVTKEVAAGLWYSAVDDQVVLEEQVNRLKQRMDYVTSRITCRTRKYKRLPKPK